MVRDCSKICGPQATGYNSCQTAFFGSGGHAGRLNGDRWWIADIQTASNLAKCENRILNSMDGAWTMEKPSTPMRLPPSGYQTAIFGRGSNPVVLQN